MKFLILFVFTLTILVAGISGQQPRCPQRTGAATCVGDRDVGSRCLRAPPRKLWYYNQTNRTCVAMMHLGCGGNSNRWCTRRACERRCNRSATLGCG